MSMDSDRKVGSIYEYTIVEAFEPNEITKLVQQKIEQGWEPFGSIAYFQFEQGMTSPILQPMVRRA
jgi:hypothetical protein